MQHRGRSTQAGCSILLADMIGHGVELSLLLMPLVIEQRPLQLPRAVKVADAHTQQPDFQPSGGKPVGQQFVGRMPKLDRDVSCLGHSLRSSNGGEVRKTHLELDGLGTKLMPPSSQNVLLWMA